MEAILDASDLAATELPPMYLGTSHLSNLIALGSSWAFLIYDHFIFGAGWLVGWLVELGRRTYRAYATPH